ncbi:unnamed protein product [Somion occarium]
MSAAGFPSIPLDIAQFTGPLLLGHLFNWGLFGALSVQTYIYYIAFPHDRLLPKSIVGFAFIAELLQTVLATFDAFRYFGMAWGNLNELNNVGFFWFNVQILGSIMSFTAQAFFAWRVWILSKNKWIVGIILILAMMSLVTGLYSGALTHIIGTFSEVQRQAYKTTCVWLSGTALCDVIIATASVVLYLHKTRIRLYNNSTFLSKFSRLTIETGLTCAIVAIIHLSLFLGSQRNNYHLAPSIALSKVHANSLLVILMATESDALADFNRLSSLTENNDHSAISISISHTKEADTDDVPRAKSISMTDTDKGCQRTNPSNILRLSSASPV